MAEHSASFPRHGSSTFAAVVAHADDADLLQRCIEHHLAVGADRVFVSLNVDDAGAREVLAGFDPLVVRGERVADFAPDPFDYFSAALRRADAWASPVWVLFADSDEFWIPAGGTLHAIAGRDDADAYCVPRYNAVPVRRAGAAVELREPAGALVVVQRHVMDAAFLRDHPDVPWLEAQIGPKVMVRPEVVECVALGAHTFTPRDSGARIVTPADVAIVHVPFTTEDRFRRKVQAIRRRMEVYGDRYRGTEAWHWRRWLEIDDAGRTGEEFAVQLVDEADVPALVGRGALATTAQLLRQARPG